MPSTNHRHVRTFRLDGVPAFYGAFGGAISLLVGHECPATIVGEASSSDRDLFFSYKWVDDHTKVTPDTPERLQAAETSLRLAMISVLGPRVINDSTFSTWYTHIDVLGLEFDTIGRTVTMPREKPDKDSARVVRLQRSSTTSRRELSCLLGSLRHVTCILRSAKQFFQRVHSACKRTPTRARFPLAEAIQLELQWFHYILEHGAWIGQPTSMVGGDPQIDVHWYMDASDHGLAVADPARKRIQLEFDAQERAMIGSTEGDNIFNINVRDLMCVTQATVLWGRDCSGSAPSTMAYIRAWSDNTSAVAWTNQLYNDTMYAQERLQAIGLCEATLRFRIWAGHLAGKCNLLADAGSRQHTDRFAHSWTNATASWT